jgi:branched-subunit amino acid aminotransferase/4-amino-4-deoxychorismate lyase
VRLVFKSELVNSVHDGRHAVKGTFAYQRKRKADEWEDVSALPLSKLKGGEGVRLEVRTEEVFKLVTAVEMLYEAHRAGGVPKGKSVALLAQVLAKQDAAKAGVAEAWMVEDGFVTEGSSSTAFIITGGKVVTRPLSTALLPGITRLAVMRLAEEAGLTIEERLFSVEEAFAAQEAFYTSASAFVMPVIDIDGHELGDGKPGALTKRLRALYLEMAGA